MMSKHFFRPFISALVMLVFVAVPSAYASALTVVSAIELVPVFSPSDEIRLQSVLADETPAAVSDPLLNQRLRQVSVRVALEDTARLQDELG